MLHDLFLSADLAEHLVDIRVEHLVDIHVVGVYQARNSEKQKESNT